MEIIKLHVCENDEEWVEIAATVYVEINMYFCIAYTYTKCGAFKGIIFKDLHIIFLTFSLWF